MILINIILARAKILFVMIFLALVLIYFVSASLIWFLTLFFRHM